MTSSKWQCLLLSLVMIAASAATGRVSAAPPTTSPQDVEAEAFLKTHIAKQRQAMQALASNRMTTLQEAIDVGYYQIRLTIDPSYITGSVNGSVTIQGRILDAGVDTLQLDLSHFLTADSVKTAGISIPFAHQEDLLSIALPTPDSFAEFGVVIYYHGRPQRQGYGSFALGTHNGKPTVATLSEPFYARSWWPCKDHPSDKADSVDMIVTIRNDLIVVSNGSLVSIVDNGDGSRTTHWHESYPIATYLVSLAIADYYAYSDTLRYQDYTMPIDFFHYGEPDNTVRGRNALVKDMIAAFSDLFGTYPFIREKYGHAQFNFGGGMEHQTCTSLGSFGEWVIAHELGHQWWGDLVTCGSWHDIWLNEGFASYSEALWEEHKGGLPMLHATMAGFEASWDTTAIYDRLYVEDTTVIEQIFNWREYRKGAWVLHMLRYHIGDSAFFQTLRQYGIDHQYGSALTADFQRIAEQQSGRDLEPFFYQWIYQGGQPDYHYSYWTGADDSGTALCLRLEQTQQGFNPFRTDVDARFFFADTSVTIRLENTSTIQDFAFHFPDSPDSCLIDPDNWILNSARRTGYPYRIIDAFIPTAIVGQPYHKQLIAVGGQAPYAWSAADVSLPIGLSVTPNGVLSGTPTEPGEYSIAVRVTDSHLPANETTALIPLVVRVIHGDIDGKEQITLGDLLHLVRYLYKDGPAPVDINMADANCDGEVDLLDVVALLNYLYLQGAAPCSTVD